MDLDEFEFIFENQVNLCRETLINKGKEYAAADDRLSNFKIAGQLQGIPPRTALGGMLAKHIVSIFDLINDPELTQLDMWNEKIGDAMNYLFLLKACVIEEITEATFDLDLPDPINDNEHPTAKYYYPTRSNNG